MIFSLAACESSPAGTPEDTTASTTEATPPVEDESVLKFTATDIFGNSVSEKDVGEKDFYFIYLWATWCPPCIQGMPDLASIAREYGDRVGFIGLLTDYDSNLEGAVNIVESSGVPSAFVMIDAYEQSVSDLLEAVQTGFVPATIILTADGEYLPIEKPYRARLNEILS